MKKIVIIDGGPRKTMNTAQMIEVFKQGVQSVSDQIEIQHVRLYDLDYKGCMSCMACKMKDKYEPSCRYKDNLTDILAECAFADGIVLASPIYYGEVTGMLRSFFERLTFPWLSYKNFGLNAPKKMPVVLIYTMNGMPSDYENMRQTTLGNVEMVMKASLGDVEVVTANNTTQVNNYDRYEFSEGTADHKKAYREAHWEEDLQKAHEAGKQMAQKIAK